MNNLLPIKPPSEHEETPEYFYENVVKPLSNDFIRMSCAGLYMDQKAVENLRVVVDNVLQEVSKTLANNKVIQEFQEHKYKKVWKKYLAEMETKKKPLEYFIRPYKADNIVCRTYAINVHLKGIDKEDLVRDKWSVKDAKVLAEYIGGPEGHTILDILDKNPPKDLADRAMKLIAKDKMEIYNKSHYTDKIANKTREDLLPPFNPGSSTQKQELFEYLGIEPLSFTDTGAAQWGRDQIEEVLYMEEDEVKKEFLQAFIDHSYSAIISQNFINSFDKFTIDDRLFGNYKNFGAKSYRPTSNSPNLLNAPSTGSIYAKPLKKCFIAPEGYLVWSIDYSALEDRVIANLSGDEGKLNIFLEGLDGHCYNALGYFPTEIEKLMPLTGDPVKDTREFKRRIDEGDKELKAIRQRGKPCTFGISYGAYPKKISDTIKCSIEEATEIFNGYHEVLYKDITKMRENVLAKAKEDGYVHLGLGCRLYSDDVDTNSRTLFNACSQFWSVLTLISVHKLHQAIDEAGLQDDVICNANIYDALYGVVKADAETIKWLNDTLVPIMETDFLENQILKNSANLEIGTSWADLHELGHDMSIEEIQELLDEE